MRVQKKLRFDISGNKHNKQRSNAIELKPMWVSVGNILSKVRIGMTGK